MNFSGLLAVPQAQDPYTRLLAPQASIQTGLLMPQSNTNDNLFQQAIKQYPILKTIGLQGVMSPGAQPYKLEMWNPGNTGDTREPRPEDIPIDKPGVQIFSNDVTPMDILADVVSHYMRENDPKVKDLYSQFVNSITPAQRQRLQGDYKYAQENEGENRPFNQWVEQTRLPAYFRGYTFDQWPQSFTSKVFTPAQLKIFDNTRKYLGLPAKGKATK